MTGLTQTIEKKKENAGTGNAVLKVVKFICGCTSRTCLVKGDREKAGCTRDCVGCKDAHFMTPCAAHRGKRVDSTARRIRRVRLYN